MLISAYADFWSESIYASMMKGRRANHANIEYKSLLVALFIVCYGAISVPAYWLKDTSRATFNSLMALYVVFSVISYILASLFNMFIPHCMRTAGQEEPIDEPSLQQTPSDDDAKTPSNETKTMKTEINIFVNGTQTSEPTTSRKYGFKMSILGGIGTFAGGTLALVLVIILSQTLPSADRQTAGLLVTTVVGCITILGSIVAYLGLPVIPAKPGKDWKAWWRELFTPFQDLLQRKNMLVLLLSYTIYTDTTLVLSSVTSQLYFTEVKPDILEYSLYSLAGNIFGVVCTLGFYLLQNWRPPFNLEYWLILGYALILVVPLWGCIGLANNISFGMKVVVPFIAKECASIA